MIISLRCLLEFQNAILFIINTFVNEHNIKWTRRKRGASYDILNVDYDAEKPKDWMPLQTIKRKLRCEKPVSILLKTLESNPRNDIVPIYSDLIKNGREISADDNTTVSHEQVIDGLLDLATDKKILSTVWMGWLGWI
jgi:hypothetical protein